jgi:hypothetical protein
MGVLEAVGGRIRCSERRGNLLEKQRCHSDAQTRAPVPRGEATVSRNAVPAAEQDALRMGWKRVRRSSRPVAWLCPVCSNDDRRT